MIDNYVIPQLNIADARWVLYIDDDNVHWSNSDDAPSDAPWLLTSSAKGKAIVTSYTTRREKLDEDTRRRRADLLKRLNITQDELDVLTS